MQDKHVYHSPVAYVVMFTQADVVTLSSDLDKGEHDIFGTGGESEWGE